MAPASLHSDLQYNAANGKFEKGNDKLYWQNIQLSKEGKLPIAPDGNNVWISNPWWKQLIIPFYYPKSYIDAPSYRDVFCLVYAQPGERFAVLPITIIMPLKDVAKYSNFSVKYKHSFTQ